MSSFDDLQFAGLLPASRSLVPVLCPLCRTVVDVRETDSTCPAGHPLPSPSANPLVSQQRSGDSGAEASAPSFVPFPALAGLQLPSLLSGSSASFLELVRAQQGLDLDALMQSLLSAPHYSNATPTSAAFLRTLAPSLLHQRDLLQAVLRVQGIDVELLPTMAEFGRQLEHGSEVSESKQETEREAAAERPQLSAAMVAAQPATAAGGLTNRADVRGRAVFLLRGGVSFAVKCSSAGQAGAVLAVVGQTEDVWPFAMTDSSGTARDIVSHTVQQTTAAAPPCSSSGGRADGCCLSSSPSLVC